MQLLPAIILCAICAIVSVSPRQKRMVGAQFASRGQFPYLVIVRRPGLECTGTIISPFWVLTAGRCVSNTHRTRFRITAGTISGGNEKDEYVQHRRVSRLIERESNERFTNESNGNYPLGLLRVNKPFKMTKYVNVVALSQYPPPYTKPCAAIGFGSSTISQEDLDKLKQDPTYQKRTKRSEPLRYYEIGGPQYNPQGNGPMPCRLLRDIHFKERYQLCSIAGAPNTAHLYVGDTGGPLVCNGVQAGVYMLSDPKMYGGSVHIIEVHTAVHYFIHWIKKYISNIVLPNADDVIHPIVPFATCMQERHRWITEKDKGTTYTRTAFATQGSSQNSRTRGNLSGPSHTRFPGSIVDEKRLVFAE